jgi:hypothetical protein
MILLVYYSMVIAVEALRFQLTFQFMHFRGRDAGIERDEEEGDNHVVLTELKH